MVRFVILQSMISFFRCSPVFVLLLFSLVTEQISAQVVIWADAIIDFSTEYSYPQYAAEQALGKPNKLPASGTSPVAWAPSSSKTEEEFIEVRFPQFVRAKQIIIAENENPGAIRRIEVGNGYGEFKEIKTFKPAAISAKSRMLRVAVPDTIGLIDKVRIEICGTCVGGFNQIDAIGLADHDGKVNAEILLVDRYQKQEPENLGRSINTGSDDFFPVISPDGKQLYFTRKGHPGNQGSELHEDIWTSVLSKNENWSVATPIGNVINSNKEEILSGITGDGSMLLIDGSYQGKTSASGQYISFKNEDGWTKPIALEINGFKSDSKTSSCMLSSDGNILLSSLEQEGGYGGKDIYVSFRIGEFSFSMPENLGPKINTAADEITPFLAPDGKTLYFSSKGFSGYGHSDIFISRKKEEWDEWSIPRNMGPDINSADWDAYFSVPADGVFGYFASYDNSIGKSDIFRILLDTDARPDSSIVLRGVVLDGISGKPVSARVSGKWDKKRQYVWSQPENGMFSIARPPKDDVEFIVEKDSFLSLRVYVNPEDTMVTLKIYPIQDNVIIPVDNIFFEQNTAKLTPESYRPLDEILGFLQVNPGVQMEIRGHTNDLCSKDFCFELSLKRARSVRKYMLEQGVPEDQLLARGYGKSNPIQSNTTAKGRKANQRVEFVIRKEKFEIRENK